jgi:hypothetical protein
MPITSYTRARRAFWSIWFAPVNKPACWAVALAVVLLLMPGCASPGSSVRWFAPATWFSHAPAAKADKAHAAEEKALVKVESAEAKTTHAAHLEFAKAWAAASFLPPSRATDLVQRFIPNGLGLLDQVRPLTADESADLRQLVRDLMSDTAATVAAAEKKQAAAESESSRLSRELTAARADAAAASLRADNADGKLRAAFDRENALANDLRAQRALFWIAVGVVVILAGLTIYAKLALGGVGAALHAAGAPVSVVQALDANLSTFGQWLVRSGRIAAAKADAVLKSTQTPASQ